MIKKEIRKKLLEEKKRKESQLIENRIVENRLSLVLGSKNNFMSLDEEKRDVSKDVCKQRIEAFYQEFMNNRGNDFITNLSDLRLRKQEVRFCVNRWEGKWGLFGGRIKDMVETLKGNTAESPSSSGVDSIFRL